MRRPILTLAAAAALVASACSSGGTATPAPSAAASGAGQRGAAGERRAGAPARRERLRGAERRPRAELLHRATYGTIKPLKPAVDLSTVGGPGEGALNIIIWAGYAERRLRTSRSTTGSQPFEARDRLQGQRRRSATRPTRWSRCCARAAAPSTTACRASGDATNRLIANGDVAAIDPTTIPGFGDVAPFLQNAPHYVVDGNHYGVPHGWGGNTLHVPDGHRDAGPDELERRLRPDGAAPYAGKITAYDSPIYIADAALYLKAHNPELGITDPYELTQPQFDAAVDLLKQQRPWVGKYWSLFSDEIDNFTNGTTVVGTTWPYQYNTLNGGGRHGRRRSSRPRA